MSTLRRCPYPFSWLLELLQASDPSTPFVPTHIHCNIPGRPHTIINAHSRETTACHRQLPFKGLNQLPVGIFHPCIVAHRILWNTLPLQPNMHGNWLFLDLQVPFE